MIQIAIVEDEKDCQDQMKDFIKRYEKTCDQTFEITVFNDGMDITEHYESTWDIIFMDIKMKHLDGMSTAMHIRKYDPAVIIIFITNMAKFAIKGYEVDALDFVLKPLEYEKFKAKMLKALNMLKKISEHKYLLLPIDDRKERVSTDQILYIEVKNHNLYFVTENDTYIMRNSLKKIEQELAGYHFARCSNSYLVNVKNVTGIEKDLVQLGQHKIPISRSSKKNFLQVLSNYLVGGYR